MLRQRLVGIYRSPSPDLITVMLESDGFDDLVSRYEYLRRIEEQDSVDRRPGADASQRDPGDGRPRHRATATRSTSKKAELERTRIQLEAREADLAAARDQKAAALDSVSENIDKLEGDICDLQDQIQAADPAGERHPAGWRRLPAGPVQGASGGWIWPVNGTADVAVRLCAGGACTRGSTSRSPRAPRSRAAKPGTVILAAYTGGYGNYTCIDHGGGLSTCYAHQSSFAVSSGDHVDQGEVIGYSGCTGCCFGPHLHFEIRVNGLRGRPAGRTCSADQAASPAA